MTAPKPRPGVLAIDPYVPGRSGTGRDTPVIKLSSNETPLGTSPKAVKAFRACSEQLHRYPDGGAFDLRAAIGRRYGLDPDRILCGNGSDELLSLLCQAYAGPDDEVMFTTHAFAIYKISAQASGAIPVEVPESNLTADVDALIARAGDKTKLCFLANPNNPTGSFLPETEIRRLRAKLPDHVLLVIDAAYSEYIRRADYSDGSELVDKGNVVMTRTFSKIFGLSALRLGWLYGPRAVIDILNRVRGPFNVNAPAQAAGIAALEDTAFIEKAVAHNDQWRPWLEQEIAALGLTIHPSIANFILAEFPDLPGRNASAAYEYLLDEGIIPRQLINYGLPNCLRFSVGLADENKRVVKALKAFVALNN